MSRLHALLVALLLAGPALAVDEPFSQLDFDAATAKAKSDGKLLLLDFTATWCPPCKMMEQRTWPDEGVRAWVAEHAVAIQLDIDQLPELAQRFDFDGIPTVIFLKDGKELDRYTGYLGPKGLVEWGENVASGKVTATKLAASMAAEGTIDEPHRRFAAAKDLADKGQLDEALEQFLWVWRNTRDVPGWLGVRHSFLLGDMARLAQRHPPARRALEDLLEEAQLNIGTVETIHWLDWIEWRSLCEKLETGGRLLAWYETHRDADGAVKPQGLDPQVVERAQHDVFEQLLARGRFAEAGHAGGDLVARTKALVDTAQLKPWGSNDFMLSHLTPMYGCAFAAGRVDVAHEIAGLVTGVLDTPEARISLARAAIDMSPTHDPQLTTLLDDASKLGIEEATLRAELERRIEQAKAAPHSGG